MRQNKYADLSLPIVERLAYGLRTVRISDKIEIWAVDKTPAELAAGKTVVRVVDRHLDVFNVGGDGITEHEHLHDWHKKNDAKHLTIAKHLTEFFLEQIENALHDFYVWQK